MTCNLVTSDQRPFCICALPFALCALPTASLAQTKSLLPFFAWLGVAIAGVALVGLAMMWYRRRVLSKGAEGGGRDLMDGLRAMRDRGELTPEEYDAAKRAMVARLAGASPPEPPRPGSTPQPVRKPAAAPGARVATPGFDLTGAPLPKPPGGSAPR